MCDADVEITFRKHHVEIGIDSHDAIYVESQDTTVLQVWRVVEKAVTEARAAQRAHILRRKAELGILRTIEFRNH
jgi:hypothetical protein